MIQVFNTLTNKKEDFQTMEPNKVRMYVCGPTVYNFIHIGNARPICVFDVFRRFLTYRGYDVTFVQNYTDVNDKIIKQSKQEDLTPEATAEKYIREYETDAKGLNVLPATVHPKFPCISTKSLTSSRNSSTTATLIRQRATCTTAPANSPATASSPVSRSMI